MAGGDRVKFIHNGEVVQVAEISVYTTIYACPYLLLFVLAIFFGCFYLFCPMFPAVLCSASNPNICSTIYSNIRQHLLLHYPSQHPSPRELVWNM